jgi:carbon-monoxide dehydrogenase medium subunit
MKPPPFAYFAPRNLAEAVALLAEHGDEGRPLAGGQSLMPLMNLRMARPSALVDLNRASDLFHIREENGWVAIGTMTRQAVAEHDALVRSRCPLVAKAISFMGHTTIRNRGTVGGSIAHADPCAELPVAALALRAQMVVASAGGSRTLSADDFFVDSLVTAIEPGEMLSEVRFPVMSAGERFAFLQTGVRRADLAIAGVAARLSLRHDGVCTEASIVALGGGPRPTRLNAVEAALVGTTPRAADLREIARSVHEDIDPNNDLQASADYRRQVLVSLTEQALTKMLAAEVTQ